MENDYIKSNSTTMKFQKFAKSSVRFGLRKKLISLFLVGVLVISVSFAFALVSLSRTTKGTVESLLIDVDNAVKVGRISILFKSEVQAWKDTLIRGKSSESFAKYSQEMDAFSEKLQTDVKSLKDTLSDEDDKVADAFVKAQSELTQAYKQARDTYLKPEAYDMAGADAAVKGKDRPVLDGLNILNDRLLNKMRASGTVVFNKAIHDNLMRALLLTTMMFSIIVAVIWVFASKISDSIHALAEKLSRAVERVSSGATNLEVASQNLASGATEGAASIEETVASLEEISSMVKLNSDNANEAATLSQASTSSANEGELEIRKLIEAISDISKSSSKIAEIISVIDDIAFQTNLLALNAAVEAARAGEQGKGFAVVAEAVRSLAQRSASAAKDINSMIRESVAKTENGVAIASRSGEALHNIVTSVKKVSDLNSEIAIGSKQQSEGLNQINQAMNQLDTVTQSNAASAEEAAASAEEMSGQAAVLQEIASKLNKIVQGGAQTE